MENMEYPDCRELEKLVLKAWQLLNDASANLPSKAWALLIVIRADYWNAREALEDMPKTAQRRIHGKRYCPLYQLDIDVYTRHWLHANRSFPVASDVLAYLRDEYGYMPEQSRFLADGQTNYTIPNAE